MIINPCQWQAEKKQAPLVPKTVTGRDMEAGEMLEAVTACSCRGLRYRPWCHTMVSNSIPLGA